MAKFCHSCGASLLDGAKFCNDCGQALPQGLPAEQPELAIQEPVAPMEIIQPQEPIVSPVAPAVKKKNPLYKRWWVWLIAVLVVGGTIFVLTNNGGLAQSPQKLIVGDWVLVADGFTLSFSENKPREKNGTIGYEGTLVEIDGNQRKPYSYTIVNDTLVIHEEAVHNEWDIHDMYYWSQTTGDYYWGEGFDYWHVTRDQLVLGDEIYTRIK